MWENNKNQISRSSSLKESLSQPDTPNGPRGPAPNKAHSTRRKGVSAIAGRHSHPNPPLPFVTPPNAITLPPRGCSSPGTREPPWSNHILAAVWTGSSTRRKTRRHSCGNGASLNPTVRTGGWCKLEVKFSSSVFHHQITTAPLLPGTMETRLSDSEAPGCNAAMRSRWLLTSMRKCAKRWDGTNSYRW